MSSWKQVDFEICIAAIFLVYDNFCHFSLYKASEQNSSLVRCQNAQPHQDNGEDQAILLYM